jgi:hypothetical protein
VVCGGGGSPEKVRPWWCNTAASRFRFCNRGQGSCKGGRGGRGVAATHREVADDEEDAAEEMLETKKKRQPG